MHRFLLKQNIERYQRLLEGAPQGRPHVAPERMLPDCQRQLAILEAEARGAIQGARPSRPRLAVRQLQQRFEALKSPAILLDPRPGLQIVDLNAPYARATMIDARRVAGHRLFNVFPDNPQDPEADGVAQVYASLRIAAATGRPHTMTTQRYDVRDADGVFVERWWAPVTTPIFTDDDRLAFLMIEVEDVTAKIMRARA
jgi:hypothetical protein